MFHKLHVVGLNDDLWDKFHGLLFSNQECFALPCFHFSAIAVNGCLTQS